MTEETHVVPRAPARPPTDLSDFDRAFETLWNRAHAAFGLSAVESPALLPWTELGSLVRAAPTDVVDTGAAYRIKAEVPGIPKEQIDIRVQGNIVEISAVDQNETTDRSTEYVYRERRATGFNRSFELPEPVVADQAKAQVVDGVLELELPKRQPTPAPTATKVKVA